MSPYNPLFTFGGQGFAALVAIVFSVIAYRRRGEVAFLLMAAGASAFVFGRIASAIAMSTMDSQNVKFVWFSFAGLLQSFFGPALGLVALILLAQKKSALHSQPPDLP